MFRITLGDLWRSLVMAVAAPVGVAILAVAGTVITAPGFDAFSVDYIQLFKDITNAMIVAAYGGMSGYLLKNFLTDKDQNFLGIKTKN
jgi:hypothetical protein